MKERGMTLIEVLISMVLMGIGILPLLSFFYRSDVSFFERHYLDMSLKYEIENHIAFHKGQNRTIVSQNSTGGAVTIKIDVLRQDEELCYFAQAIFRKKTITKLVRCEYE